MTPDGLQAAGPGPRAPVAHGPQPRLGLLADAVGEAVELAFQPALEGGAPVIDQHAHLLEHLGGPSGADVPGPQCREDLGVADGVAGGVPGQHDDQRPADAQADPAFPAAGLTPPVGQVDRPDEPRVVQVGVAVLVETGEILAGFEQPRLEPPDRRGTRRAPAAVCAERPAGRADGPAPRPGGPSSGRRTAGGSGACRPAEPRPLLAAARRRAGIRGGPAASTAGNGRP